VKKFGLFHHNQDRTDARSTKSSSNAAGLLAPKNPRWNVLPFRREWNSGWNEGRVPRAPFFATEAEPRG